MFIIVCCENTDHTEDSQMTYRPNLTEITERRLELGEELPFLE